MVTLMNICHYVPLMLLLLGYMKAVKKHSIFHSLKLIKSYVTVADRIFKLSTEHFLNGSKVLCDVCCNRDTVF